MNVHCVAVVSNCHYWWELTGATQQQSET